MVDVDYAQSFLAIVSPAGPALGLELSFESADGSDGNDDESNVQTLRLTPPTRSIVLEFMRLSDGDSLTGSFYKLRFWGYCPDKRAAITPPPPSVAAKPASETKPPPEARPLIGTEVDLFNWPASDDFHLSISRQLQSYDKEVDPQPLPLQPAQTDPGRRWLYIKGDKIIQSSESADFRLGPTFPSGGTASYVSVEAAGWQLGKLAVANDREFTYVPVIIKLVGYRDEVVLGDHDYPGPDFEIRVIGSYREDGTIKFA